MPRFHVRDAFPLQDQAVFVLAGFIIHGEITAGMAVTIPFNAKANLTAEIERVEFVRRPDGDVVCLFIKCTVPDEATLWEALKLKDRTLEVA